MTNMTYAMALEIAINAVTDETVKEKLEALKTQLAKRSTSKTPTKTQKANEEVKAVIANVLVESGEKMTVTEMIADERLNNYTNQKISALLRQMVEAGKVTKTLDGKKAYFTVAIE